MYFEDSNVWKVHVAMKIFSYSLQVRNLVREGKVWKAIRINQLIMDWDTAVAKYKIDQAIKEVKAITLKRMQMRESPLSPKKSNQQTHPGSY